MPDVGRWGVVDPLADLDQDKLPFNYALNNPVIFVDPDGMWVSGGEAWNMMNELFNTEKEEKEQEKNAANETYVDKEDNKVRSTDIEATFSGNDFEGSNYGQDVYNIDVSPNFEPQKTKNHTNGPQIRSYTANYTLHEWSVSSWKK